MASKIERIDELTEPPVPGNFYLVPSVHGLWWSTKKWWPVMGDLHDDTKFFRFTQKHYHLDRRFLPDALVERAASCPLHARPAEGVGLSEPQWRRRLCVRSTSYFPTFMREVSDMQAGLAGAQCKAGPAGWICPHRGFALGSVPADEQGIITCPLHGLRIKADTGEVITLASDRR